MNTSLVNKPLLETKVSSKKLFQLVNFETMYQIHFILDYSLFLLNDLVLLYHLILQMHLHVFPSSLSVYWNTKLSLART